MSNSSRIFHHGYISLLFFVVYIAFLQLDKRVLIDIEPIIKVILGLSLTIIGIIFGYIGFRKKIQKKICLLGIILNGLGLLSFTIGLIEGFTN